MREKLLLMTAVAIALAVHIDPAICGEDEARSQDPNFRQAEHLLDTWIESVIDFERLPGLSIAVVHDQEIVYAKGFGYSDVDRRLRAEPSTIYGICSMSKMFTAVAVLQLRDDGKLKLDDPVAKYLPWFAPKGETPEDTITVRSLLRHSGGLPDEVDHTVRKDQEELEPEWDEFLRRARNLKLTYPANTRFNYSNLGYELLGHIVATVSGQSYASYVREHILDPLEMTNTILLPPDPQVRSSVATGYGRRPRRPGPRVGLTDREPGAFAPAGGYYSSVLDMAKFAMWQCRVRVHGDDRILSRRLLEEMQSVQWQNPKWGLGFTYYWIGDLELWGHQGGCAKSGFKAQFIICPEEKTAVVVMINASDGPQFALAFSAYEILSAALRAQGDGGNKPNAWSQFAGYYTADRAWSDAEVVEWGDGLALLWIPTQNPVNSLVRLRHVDSGVFRQVDDDGSLGKHYIFQADASGDVRLRFNNNILQKTER